MRRTLTAAVAITAGTLGLAAPAVAAEDSPTPPDRPISLSCEHVEIDDGYGVHCEWTAFDGAATYRVVRVAHRRHAGIIRARKTTETSFTKEMGPGRYWFGVQALDEDGKAIARSNRVRVVVPRDDD